jgi:hypothetical protein
MAGGIVSSQAASGKLERGGKRNLTPAAQPHLRAVTPASPPTTATNSVGLTGFATCT